MKRWLLIPLAALSVLATVVLVRSTPLPFPTPSQQELVVLTQLGALTFDDSDPAALAGFEHDLAEMFAEELGVSVRFVTASQEDFPDLIRANKAHFAAAWLTPDTSLSARASQPFFKTRDVLVQHEASLPLDELDDLAGRTVHVLAGSRQAVVMAALKDKVARLNVVEVGRSSAGELLEAVASRKVELAVVDEAMFDLALAVAPSLQATLYIGDEQPIAWVFPEKANPELVARADAFLARIQRDPAFLRLKERYFGHIHRLDGADISKLIEQSKVALPKLRPLFQHAQAATGIDWRLIAAVAYQESQWDPGATSETGVRGFMQLTEDTARHLGVSDRLDPRQSVLAAARYLRDLKEKLPKRIVEPDRTWFALAAFNLGLGHLEDARVQAQRDRLDPDRWRDVRKALPLLALPEYYEKARLGYARGGMPVAFVDRVRAYYDILLRTQDAHQPRLRVWGAYAGP